MSENPKWLDNRIQFARLLSEIYSCIEFDENSLVALEQSMDLNRDHIFDLFERADNEWQAIKARYDFSDNSIERYFIRSLEENENGEALFWNNERGWVNIHEADVFNSSDQQTLKLPTNSNWEKVKLVIS